MAQAESSNVGEDAERSDVTPTRQVLSRMREEPRLVAAETAGATDGAARWPRLWWLWGLEAAVRAGFGDGGAAWAASSAAPQTAIQTADRNLSRKRTPQRFYSLYLMGVKQGTVHRGTYEQR